MEQQSGSFTGIQVIGIVIGAVVITMVATLLVARSWLFPAPFEPVVLTADEQQQLEVKLERFSGFGSQAHATQVNSDGVNTDAPALEPEAYSEEGTNREIHLSEREVNSIIAKNTELAPILAIDLSEDLISAKMIIPVDPDFPMLGGKNLKVRAGVELAYRQGRPVVKLRGVSLMGVPLPNAWLGGLKNIDLVREFGNEEGFWKAFADGVESVQAREGKLEVTLRE